MVQCDLYIGSLLIFVLGLNPFLGFSQQVENVPQAFEALSTEPEIILLNNEIDVPLERGHLQGVQVIETNGSEKMLISGSSLEVAYILQADLATRKTDILVPLMREPYRHAGGIQVAEPYLIVGIEDNFLKTSSKVSIYNFQNRNLYKAQPKVTFDRVGEPELQTAGATGLLAIDDGYLMVVGNWSSRNWDFSFIKPEKNEHTFLERFTAPNDWASYQSINLIMDQEAVYAIGFYNKKLTGYADLILVSKLESPKTTMEKISTKAFNCKNGVDFNTAAGLQVDKEGKLHIWGTQRDALKQITVNKFSPK